MKRSITTAVVLLALAVGGCSDDGDVAETGETPETTEAAVDVVTPVVVCADPQRGAAYFGYTNSGETTVEIPVGEANTVTAPEGDVLTEQQPEVFAPGEQGVVFWTEFVDASVPPTWSITSADGTARTASADESAPECPEGPDGPEGPDAEPPDDREVTIEAEVDTSGGNPVITLSAAGMSDESRCPAGPHEWTPEAPVAAYAVVGSNLETLESDDDVVVVEVVDPAAAPFEGFDTVGFASAFVTVDVVDRCADAAGSATWSWGVSDSLRDLSQLGTNICFGVVDEGYEEVPCSEGPQLAPTGGIRNR